MLRGESSQSVMIITRLGLTRDIIRGALSELERKCAQHAALCPILCAMRFKYYEFEKILNTSCAKCGEEDSLHHLLSSADLEAPASKVGPEETADVPTGLPRDAHQMNAGTPVLRRATNT